MWDNAIMGKGRTWRVTGGVGFIRCLVNLLSNSSVFLLRGDEPEGREKSDEMKKLPGGTPTSLYKLEQFAFPHTWFVPFQTITCH